MKKNKKPYTLLLGIFLLTLILGSCSDKSISEETSPGGSFKLKAAVAGIIDNEKSSGLNLSYLNKINYVVYDLNTGNLVYDKCDCDSHIPEFGTLNLDLKSGTYKLIIFGESVMNTPYTEAFFNEAGKLEDARIGFRSVNNEHTGPNSILATPDLFTTSEIFTISNDNVTLDLNIKRVTGRLQLELKGQKPADWPSAPIQNNVLIVEIDGESQEYNLNHMAKGPEKSTRYGFTFYFESPNQDFESRHTFYILSTTDPYEAASKPKQIKITSKYKPLGVGPFITAVEHTIMTAVETSKTTVLRTTDFFKNTNNSSTNTSDIIYTDGTLIQTF